MKLLALFLAVLTVAYLLPFSVFAENVANDAVITLGTKGVSPNLKPALNNTIGKYYTALGRNIGEGIGEIALSPVTAFVSESASKFVEFITTGVIK